LVPTESGSNPKAQRNLLREKEADEVEKEKKGKTGQFKCGHPLTKGRVTMGGREKKESK